MTMTNTKLADAVQDGHVLYFAYGTKLNLKEMEKEFPNAKPVSKAILHSYSLTFRNDTWGYSTGLATMVPFFGRGKGKVLGAVYAVPIDELEALDNSEKCPSMYDRKIVTVQLPNRDDLVYAVTYIMQDSFIDVAPDYRYEKVIRKGYNNWKWKVARLEEAVYRCQVREAKDQLNDTYYEA